MNVHSPSNCFVGHIDSDPVALQHLPDNSRLFESDTLAPAQAAA